MIMISKFSSVLLGVVFVLACARNNNERDSQIGRTTYDGSEDMVPASRTVDPSPSPSEPAATPAPEPAAAPDTIGQPEPESVADEVSPASDAAPTKAPDVIYVPTPQPVVDKMLELARVTKDDLVYDLGCGDGRIVVTAAKRYKAHAIGFDIDPVRVKEARANVKKNKVEHLVTIEQKDIFTLDLSPANVVTLYLLPKLNDRLVPQLEKLAAGSRVVSHDFSITGIVPVRELSLRPSGQEDDHEIYFYTIPFQRKQGLALPRQTVPAPNAH
jgi:SAM-dependent methyltransferase